MLLINFALLIFPLRAAQQIFFGNYLKSIKMSDTTFRHDSDGMLVMIVFVHYLIYFKSGTVVDNVSFYFKNNFQKQQVPNSSFLSMNSAEQTRLKLKI